MEKQSMERLVEALAPELIELSHRIHQQPELAFQEHYAAKWVADFLNEKGFDVTLKVAGIETAVKGVVDSGKPGPTLALLAEYDALPELGHACGHNVIAATSLGAAAALAQVVGETGGKVILLGTPAEEIGGGKICLLKAGVFDGVDFALMTHPANENLVGRASTACSELVMEFYGQSAHSSKPEKGIDALKPLIQMFNHVHRLLPTFSQRARINGIITAGGVASNIIVEHACGKFLIRSNRKAEVEEILLILQQLAEEEAKKVGAGVKLFHDEVYGERYPNFFLEGRFKNYLEAMGETVTFADPDEPTGSSDMGNISMVMPTIHPYLKIAPSNVNGHTLAFTAASVSPRADEMIVKGATALAKVGYDLLTDPVLREAAMKEFKEKALKQQ